MSYAPFPGIRDHLSDEHQLSLCPNGVQAAVLELNILAVAAQGLRNACQVDDTRQPPKFIPFPLSPSVMTQALLGMRATCFLIRSLNA